MADLPGLVVDSHKNKGLGIGFLRHAERCSTLAMVLDLSEPEPWSQLEALRRELTQFSPELAERPQLIIANKIDLPEAKVLWNHLYCSGITLFCLFLKIDLDLHLAFNRKITKLSSKYLKLRSFPLQVKQERI